MQRAKTVVIYHASCPDGFGAAWAAHRVLGERAQYLPMNHGDPIPQMDNDARVYILDFSFDRERMGELQREHGQDNVILLDHHITADQELSELPNCHIDLSKSGAVLSWEHFHTGSTVPTLLLYVQDKDLWTWELPDSRAISAYLSSREMDFDTWDNIARDLETAEGQLRAVEAGKSSSGASNRTSDRSPSQHTSGKWENIGFRWSTHRSCKAKSASTWSTRIRSRRSRPFTLTCRPRSENGACAAAATAST